MEIVKTKCVNGELQAGDLVIATPDDDYACLIGRVLKINLLGTCEHDEETENNTDDIHINFMEFDYSENRIKEIEALFSNLYDEEKNFDECPVDDVIMAPDSLICITGIEENLLNSLLQSGFNTACYCYDILRKLTTQHETTSNLITEPQIMSHILETIDTSIALAGYKVIDGDKCSIIIRHSESDTDYEVKIEELIP